MKRITYMNKANNEIIYSFYSKSKKNLIYNQIFSYEKYILKEEEISPFYFFKNEIDMLIRYMKDSFKMGLEFMATWLGVIGALVYSSQNIDIINNTNYCIDNKIIAMFYIFFWFVYLFYAIIKNMFFENYFEYVKSLFFIRGISIMFVTKIFPYADMIATSQYMILVSMIIRSIYITILMIKKLYLYNKNEVIVYIKPLNLLSEKNVVKKNDIFK